MMVVLTLVFSNLFRFTLEHYPVYVLSGLIVWNFFSSTTIQAMQGMIMSGGLLNRIYVPKSVFTVSALGTGLVNLGISLVPLLAIALLMGVRINLAIFVIPVAVLLLALFALGMGLILASAAVYFADMLPVYEVILTLWMYATPIIYPPEVLPPDRIWLFKINPMYHLVQIFRGPLYEGVVPDWSEWAIAAATALIVFIVGSLIFTSKINEYAYRT
jgi:ABC-type polysaccharide/polyol phosphate export permease